jgi:hypothetical protein
MALQGFSFKEETLPYEFVVHRVYNCMPMKHRPMCWFELTVKLPSASLRKKHKFYSTIENNIKPFIFTQASFVLELFYD